MFMTPALEFESPLHRTALAQLDAIAERLNLDSGIHERLRYPRRALTVSIPVLMDDGRTEVFTGSGSITIPLWGRARAGSGTTRAWI